MKLILDKYNLIAITFYRFTIGQGLLILYLVVFQRKKVKFGLQGIHRFPLHIIGVILGPMGATLFWVAGFKYAKAGLVAVLNQTSTVFIFLFAWLLLKEPITRYKLASIGFAFVGVVLITLN